MNLTLRAMTEISKQDLALMNAEMAARIFMHIAEQKNTQTVAPAKTYELTDEEQQALRDMFGPAEGDADPQSPDNHSKP